MRWAEEHTLIWAAHQLEQWSQRLAEERGEEPPQPDEVLTKVRNAREHLDDADIEKGHAVPGQRGSNRSLRALPGGSLAIALGSGLVADLLTIDELEKRALAVGAEDRGRAGGRPSRPSRVVPGNDELE